MTTKDCLVLQHNKYIAYLQIYAGFCLAIIAGQAFRLFEVKSDLFGIIIINNFVMAVIVGVIGLVFFRSKLKAIEHGMANCHRQ